MQRGQGLLTLKPKGSFQVTGVLILSPLVSMLRQVYPNSHTLLFALYPRIRIIGQHMGCKLHAKHRETDKPRQDHRVTIECKSSLNLASNVSKDTGVEHSCKFFGVTSQIKDSGIDPKIKTLSWIGSYPLVSRARVPVLCSSTVVHVRFGEPPSPKTAGIMAALEQLTRQMAQMQQDNQVRFEGLQKTNEEVSERLEVMERRRRGQDSSTHTTEVKGQEIMRDQEEGGIMRIIHQGRRTKF
ncbi:unnamed protein product [Sphenostylis stenocarpa]|uniref:Uncharacterized protein n=1 Tax=Sphenostylis stenocarpa TaxID=92480 RepID=A0AA86SC41_9FABA|nr:unnamed protein product [Sphenostylis stenocarpa]